MPRLRTGIYAIRNSVTGDRYVGQAVDIDLRWIDHRRALMVGLASSPKLQEAWNLHGSEAFVFEVLQECEASDLDELEDSHMREGCIYNHVQPLPRIVVSLEDPEFVKLFSDLDDQLATMSATELDALEAQLDAEEREEEAGEQAEIAEADALEQFMVGLGSTPKGETCSKADLQRAKDYLSGGETMPVQIAARVYERAQQYDQAEHLYLLACDSQENRAAQGLRGVDCGVYLSLAKLYRKLKRYQDEVLILERFAKQRQAPYAAPKDFAQLLDKAKSRTRQRDAEE